MIDRCQNIADRSKYPCWPLSTTKSTYGMGMRVSELDQGAVEEGGLVWWITFSFISCGRLGALFTCGRQEALKESKAPPFQLIELKAADILVPDTRGYLQRCYVHASTGQSVLVAHWGPTKYKLSGFNVVADCLYKWWISYFTPFISIFQWLN